MQSIQLINLQIAQVAQITAQVKLLKTKSTSALTWKNDPNTWCILECLAHLNLYGDFYFPLIQEAIQKSTTKSESEFKSGLLGGYFAKSMLPKDKMQKMKTFKSKNPLNADLDSSTINTFIQQQDTFIELLHSAKAVSLNQIKIKTTLSPLLKLKLGDIFQFIINHNIRHLKQIERLETHMENLNLS